MFIVLVAGASGSGKTTIVKHMKSVLNENGISVTIISVDQFYRSMHPHEPRNWDHLSAINMDALEECVRSLKENKSVRIPDYDYVTHQSIPNSILIGGESQVVIVEGLFSLCDNRLCSLADMKIYVEADLLKHCLPRRFHRDVNERGRSGESIIDQYVKQVIPGFEEFVLPSKVYADIAIPNHGSHPHQNTPFIKIVCNYIIDQVKGDTKFSSDD